MEDETPLISVRKAIHGIKPFKTPMKSIEESPYSQRPSFTPNDSRESLEKYLSNSPSLPATVKRNNLVENRAQSK